MSKLILLLFTNFVSFSIATAQIPAEYSSLINEGWDLYEKKEYHRSGEIYNKAFLSWGDKGLINDRYNAACSWALAGYPDSAFHHLFRIAGNGIYSNLNHMVNDSDLFSLHHDTRWSQIVDKVRANKEKEEEHLDKELVALLDTVFNDDQAPRREIEAIMAKYGRESGEMKAHWKKMNETDSINLIKVSAILDERGWLGPDEVGGRGSQTLFLVIQHADLEVQEKYLPMLRGAVKDGKASASSLALLEDRIALRKGEKQIYGSQIGVDEETGENFILPLADPMNVDARRAEVGLGPLADYVSRWNIVWDPAKYMEEMKKTEEKK